MKTAYLGIAAVLAGLLTVTAPTATGAPATAAPASASAAPHRAQPRLEVGPRVYVGGQRLTWKGTVGGRGIRPLQLQFNMGSVVGNAWDTVEGFQAHTRADGRFSFTYPAPSMFDVAYRVVAGGRATPAHVFRAKTQDLTIRLDDQPDNSVSAPGLVRVGDRFGITVDTTPDYLVRSPESSGLPVFQGRGLTLQKRAGTAWRTVARSRVRGDGSGHFAHLRAKKGVAVYRVREENVGHGHQIGWTQSFPLYVLVGQRAQDWYADHYGHNEPAREARVPNRRLGAQPQTASQLHAWFPSVFDFAWEYGQSLSSPPSRGTRLHGSWIDRSSGSGRVAKYNGGLAIDSKRYTGAGAGDFGTTSATMTGNAMTYGRWETSLRIRNAFERGGHAYQVLAELVPASGSRDCGASHLTIASISPFSRQVRFGAQTGRTAWSGRAAARYTPYDNAYNVAVEVAPGHVTWFLNGKAVGSTTDAGAIPGVPMTLRLSLQGHGDDEMDQVGLISDWQRGFPLDTGQQSVSRRHLSAKRVPDAC